MYDVIIAGAGPAGLSAAGELSKNKDLSILLLEKNKIGQTNRTWAEFTEQLKERELLKAISKRINDVSFGTYQLGIDTRKINFAVLDQKKLLLLLKSRIGKNVRILERCSFNSFEHKDGFLDVWTSKGTFRCKVLIDASGFMSPVSKKYKLQDDIFVWQCMAYEIERKTPKKLDEIIVEIPFKAEEEVDFWIDISKGKKCSVGLMYLTKSNKMMTKKKMKNYLKRYMKMKNITGEITSVKEGIIAMSDFKKSSFDNILLAGNSGSHAAPDTGYGLITALDNGVLAAQIASKAISLGKFKRSFLKKYDKELKRRYKVRYRFNRILQLLHYNLDFDEIQNYITSFKESTKWMIKKTESRLTVEEMYWFFTHFLKEIPVFYLIRKLPFSVTLQVLKEFLMFNISVLGLRIKGLFIKDERI